MSELSQQIKAIIENEPLSKLIQPCAEHPGIMVIPATIDLAGAEIELVSIDDAVKSCEVAVVLVSHDEFKMVPLAERRHLEVIDTCGIWQDMPIRH